MTKIIWTANLDQRQQELWHTALSSQQITVVQQSAQQEIVHKLNSVYRDERNCPDLLLLDVGIKSHNSEALQFGSICQWASEKLNPLKIVLVNPRQDRVRNLEKNWAMRRGADDLLPRITADNYFDLVGAVTQLLGRPCALDLLRSAMRGYWQEDRTDTDTTGDLAAGFLQPMPLPQVVSSIKNSSSTQAPAKQITYRGVRIKR